MNDALRVGGRESIRDFNGNLEQAVQFHRLSMNHVTQWRTVQIFHSDKRFASLFTDVVDGTDVRMVQRRSGTRLAPKPFERLRIS